MLNLCLFLDSTQPQKACNENFMMALPGFNLISLIEERKFQVVIALFPRQYIIFENVVQIALKKAILFEIIHKIIFKVLSPAFLTQ